MKHSKDHIEPASKVAFGNSGKKSRLKLILPALLLTLVFAAGVAAQTDNLLAMITAVESRAFPQVTAAVAVLDESGPVSGLTAADFQLFEDGRAVPAETITVTGARLENLQLVLALDVSTPVENLATLQSAAGALLSTLEPKDELALVSFGDEADLVYTFTNNTEQLQVSLEALTPQGNYTALHQGLDQALTAIEALPAGRKAIIAVTDRRDNVGEISAEAIITRAQAAQIPLYVIGMGSKVAIDPLQEMVGQTGGRYITVEDAEGLPAVFELLAEELRLGYQLTFTSGIQADNSDHSLTVVAAVGGQQARSEGRFQAVPGEVVVSLPNLQEGQTVGGVVDLMAQVEAPGQVSLVEYQVDGQPLAQVVDPPYTFEWDTTRLVSGSHRLGVTVVDQAGNRGQTELNLNVVPPLVVSLPVSQTRVEVGQPITVPAQIEALAPVSQVELSLDGQPLTFLDQPPFRFTFDSTGYTAGEHVLTVRVEDELGRTAEASLMVAFVAPPAPEPPFWQRWYQQLSQNEWVRLAVVVAGWGLILLLVLAILILGLTRIAAIQRERRRKLYTLELANRGNVSTPYELSLDDPLGLLKFEFGLYGVKLAEHQVAQTRTAPLPARPAPAAAEARPAPEPSRASASPTGGGVRQTVDKASQASASSMQTAGALAGIFSMVASLLPGSAGASARRASGKIRQGQSTVRQVTYAPQRVTRTADQIKSRAKRVAPASASSGGSSVESRSSNGGSAPVHTGQTGRPPPPTNGSQTATRRWAQTPVVEPGEAVVVDLVIDPVKLRQTRPYIFKILSRPVEADEDAIITETAKIQLSRGSCLLRFLPYVAFIALVFLLAAAGLFVWFNWVWVISFFI